jgi:hypothetical protein
VGSGTGCATTVDTTDPRYVTMTKATARSHADRRVISHFDLLLVDRTPVGRRLGG